MSVISMGKNEPYKWTSSLSGSGPVEGCQFFFKYSNSSVAAVLYAQLQVVQNNICDTPLLTRHPVFSNKIPVVTQSYSTCNPALARGPRRLEVGSEKG